MHAPPPDAVLRVVLPYVHDQLDQYLWSIGTNISEHVDLMRVAKEESGYKPGVVNGNFRGIYQYGPATWVDNGCNVYGNYWDYEINWQGMAQCALHDWRNGMKHQWQVTWFW